MRDASCYFWPGLGWGVGETVADMAEGIDFGKAWLHILSANAKLKKARTVVLLSPVINALQKYLADRSEGWLFLVIVESMYLHDRSRKFLIALQNGRGCKRWSIRIGLGLDDTEFIHIFCGIPLLCGVWIMASDLRLAEAAWSRKSCGYGHLTRSIT